MQYLYKRNDPVDSAYMVPSGNVSVGIGEARPVEFQASNAIVGSLEHFLDGLEPRNKLRLFDFGVEQKQLVKVIPFSLVEQMMTQYQFGFETNIFLARILEHTTAYSAQQDKSIPDELLQYRLRARHFTRLVHAIEQFAQIHEWPELEAIAAAKRTREFYLDGLTLSREIALRAISSPAVPLSQYVNRYQKNTSICREGVSADCMYVLLRGVVTVVSHGRKIARIDQPGEALGELALFLDGRRTATLIAAEDTDVYEIKRDTLKQFFNSHRSLFQNIAATLAKRIHDNIENILRFEQKVKELQEEDKRTRGRFDSLAERSRLEVSAFCQELLEFQGANESKPLDRFLIDNNFKHVRF